MEELNEAALNHHGPTDVICFDLRTPGLDFPKGESSEFDADIEIYVCPDVARREAEKRARDRAVENAALNTERIFSSFV